MNRSIGLFTLAVLVYANAPLRSWAQDEVSVTTDTLSISLQDAIKISLEENPSIIVADKEIVIKKESRKEAYSGLFPEANISAGFNRTLKKQTMVMDFGGQSQTIQVGSDNSYNGGINISLPLFAPALYKSINLSKTDVDLAVEKSRASKLDLVNQVSKAYYQLMLSQDSYNVILQSYEQAKENYRVISAKYEQGSVSEYDKIRAEVQMRSLNPNVIAARNAISLSAMQLQVLMGMDTSTPIKVKGSLKDYEMELFKRMAPPEVDLSNNSDLKQMDLNEKSLKNTVSLQKSNLLPTLSLAFNYTYTSLNNDFKFSEYRWFPYSMIGFQLNIPIFTGSNFTKIKKARLQLDQLKDTRLNTERQLKMQATSYLNSMEASTEQVVSNRENIVQAEKGRSIARKRYEVGKGTIIELNDAEVALIQARLSYHQSIYDYMVSKVDLEKVLGNGFEEYVNDNENEK